MGRLENVLDFLSETEPPTGRLLSFGEFERSYTRVLSEGEGSERKTLAVAANPLISFTPQARPVFWRMLLVQARLYQALLRTRTKGFVVPTSDEEWKELLRLDRDRLVGADVDQMRRLDEATTVTDTYLAQYVEPRLRTVAP